MPGNRQSSSFTSLVLLQTVVRDGENLDKMKEKGDACIFVGYSTQSNAYRVFIKRTRMIVETIHVNFDELPQMASDHVSSDPVDIPLCKNVINLKWLWKNKRDEENTVIRNKSRLVAKGYAQKEGIISKSPHLPHLLCHKPSRSQSSPAFPNQAHRCQISPHKGQGEKGFKYLQTTRMEIFDSKNELDVLT
ncbi:retrovirus-related pol polyprotein from transposon TNT 1-94 [Tanacetum coccineum]